MQSWSKSFVAELQKIAKDETEELPKVKAKAPIGARVLSAGLPLAGLYAVRKYYPSVYHRGVGEVSKFIKEF